MGFVCLNGASALHRNYNSVSSRCPVDYDSSFLPKKIWHEFR